MHYCAVIGGLYQPGIGWHVGVVSALAALALLLPPLAHALHPVVQPRSHTLHHLVQLRSLALHHVVQVLARALQVGASPPGLLLHLVLSVLVVLL